MTKWKVCVASQESLAKLLDEGWEPYGVIQSAYDGKFFYFLKWSYEA